LTEWVACRTSVVAGRADPDRALELVEPAVRYRTSFLEAMQEQEEANGEGIFDPQARHLGDFDTYVQALLDEQGRPPGKPGLVPMTVLWLVTGDTYLGRVNLRHRLTPRLRRIGGHIGYEIRPSRRRRGCATRALALTLQRARALGLRKVLLTCDAENVGSWRTMEANGGVLEGVFRLRGWPESIRRYWIDLRTDPVALTGSRRPRKSDETALGG
jgi:predicted acetyltransferase